MSLFAAISVKAINPPPPTTFTFYLDEPCKTSAGVFQNNGALVRTLWSKVPYYAPGTYSGVWDGLDDYSNALSAGTYQIKVLQHNTAYVWDGVIGNSSTASSGPTVHRGFYTIQDMALTGTNGFYVSGYNEGKYAFRCFATNNPQTVANSWFWDINQFHQLTSAPGLADRSWLYSATDGNWVYFACQSCFDPANQAEYGYPGCVVACAVSNCGTVSFTAGTVITNGNGDAFPNGIYVGTQPGISGLAVQQSGNLLAVSVAPDNKVYLSGKNSGSPVGTLSVTSPGRLSFSPDGTLWVISGNNTILHYTNLTSSPKVSLTLSSCSEPLAVAVSPTNANLILVADGGSSQQVKAFNSAGTLLWTYGLPGGYPANGVAVATNKFWFSYEGVDQTFLSIAPDGSFWVGDEENHRVLHFSAGLNYIEQIMYQPHSYRTSVDQNNPCRVFNQFLEYYVDYTKPLSQAWTLVNNWKVNVPSNNITYAEGIYQVTDFPNGRTYALIDNVATGTTRYELCELTTNMLRLTGLFPMLANGLGWSSFGADGSAYQTIYGSAQWYKATLSGFDASNNPIWNTPVLIASAPNGSTNPVPRCCSGNIYTAISTNNILISYDSTLNNGYHFGAIQLGTANWLWQAGPSANLNGKGNYEIGNGLTYAGNAVYAVDRNVYFGFHGENFRNQGEAAQHFHYYDDGLFVSQFGEANIGYSVGTGAISSFAGNAISPTFMKTTNVNYGDYYLWVNDESDHGLQRWHLANARNIREQMGTGSLGGNITLTNPPAGFPVNLSVANASQSAGLLWTPVAGATAYNIYYSVISGGPYNMVAGHTSSTGYNVTGLTNGQTYYCVVTATVAGTEGMPSEQVELDPYDTTQAVIPWGSMAEPGQGTPVNDLDSNAVASNLPSWLDSEHIAGNLTPADLVNFGYGHLNTTAIGTQGYLIYNWGGYGVNLTNLSSAFTISAGSGWMNQQFLGRQFNVNGSLGNNYGLQANPVGTINIGVTDTNYHVLTVVCPAKFADNRQFTITLSGASGGSAQYSVNEAYGYNHTFQFLFKGNATLTANATGGNEAIVQALFVDNLAPAPSAPYPPTDLHIISPSP